MKVLRVALLVTSLVLSLVTSLAVGAAAPSAADRAASGADWDLASARADGAGADAATTDASITADGRWLVFSTFATNLSGRDRDGEDAFLRDNRSGTVRPVAVFGRRGRIARSSHAPSISPNGRFVAFCSADPRIVRPDSFEVLLPADHPDIDVFVRDLRTGAVRRASTDRRGKEADDFSCAPEVADTGDVVFESQAMDLVRGRLGGERGDTRLYLYDWSSRRVRLLAQQPSAHAISADGRTVVATISDTLVPADDLPGTDAYVLRRPRRGKRLGTWRVYDPERPAGATTDGCTGAVDVSGDGDWFAAICNSGLGEAGTPDKRAFRFHRRTGRSEVLDGGPTGHLGPLDVSLSDDGRTIAIAEPAYPLVAATADSDAPDVMLWRHGAGLGLFTSGHDAWWDHQALELSGDGSTLVFSSQSDAMSPDDLNGEHQVDLFLSRLR